MLKITKIQNGCNSYIVEQGDKAVLIDPGMKRGIQKVIDACKGKNISLIMITHGHSDHIEGVAEVAKQLNVPIAMNEKDITLIENNLNQPLNGRGVMGKILRAFLIKSMVKDMAIPHFDVDILLKESTNLSEYGFDGRIIEVPGHTEGSVAIRMEDQLFSGDILNNAKPSLSYFYADLQQLEESAEKLMKEENVTFQPGHGKSFQFNSTHSA